MRRTVALALVLVVAGCGTAADPEPRRQSRPAEPQRAELDWRERYPDTGPERLVFEVDSLAVTANGWTAAVAITNETSIGFQTPGATESRFGLMLFATGSLAEVERAASSGGLPRVREATTIDPAPPSRLAPGVTWRARLSARGSLPAGAYVRVVFGPLRADGDPPAGMEAEIVWITDSSHRLRARGTL